MEILVRYGLILILCVHLCVILEDALRIQSNIFVIIVQILILLCMLYWHYCLQHFNPFMDSNKFDFQVTRTEKNLKDL